MCKERVQDALNTQAVCAKTVLVYPVPLVNMVRNLDVESCYQMAQSCGAPASPAMPTELQTLQSRERFLLLSDHSKAMFRRVSIEEIQLPVMAMHPKDTR